MNKYGLFLAAFIAFAVAFIVFMTIYLNHFFTFMVSNFEHLDSYSDEQHLNPFRLLGELLGPKVIVSGIIMWITSLTYKIIGIVYVAKSKAAAGGEKALWIVGFCLLGFITGIVFLIMAKERQLV